MTMKPMQPITLGDEKRYYNVAAAARLIGVKDQTLWRWAAKNLTSFGLELGVVRAPATEWRNKLPPRKRRDFRLLVPEDKVMLLKRLLHDFPLSRGQLSEYDIDTMRRAARLYAQSERTAPPYP